MSVFVSVSMSMCVCLCVYVSACMSLYKVATSCWLLLCHVFVSKSNPQRSNPFSKET